MRKTNDKSLKEAIEQMLQVYKLKRKYDETGIVASWAGLVGKPVANPPGFRVEQDLHRIGLYDGFAGCQPVRLLCATAYAPH